MAQVSVIIPALNEAESIGHVVAELPWSAIAECIVVDNGSTDATARIAAESGARVVQSPRGYGAACLAGSNAALAASDILVYMYGDGADVPAFLDRLIAPTAAGEADFAIGSRLRGTREPGSMLPSQVFAGRFVGFLLRHLQGVRYTDMCAFRAIRRSCLAPMKMSEMTYGWNLDVQIKAAQRGLRSVEIPVDSRCRFKTGIRILEVLRRAGVKRRG